MSRLVTTPLGSNLKWGGDGKSWNDIIDTKENISISGGRIKGILPVLYDTGDKNKDLTGDWTETRSITSGSADWEYNSDHIWLKAGNEATSEVETSDNSHIDFSEYDTLVLECAMVGTDASTNWLEIHCASNPDVYPVGDVGNVKGDTLWGNWNRAKTKWDISGIDSAGTFRLRCRSWTDAGTRRTKVEVYKISLE